MCVCVHAGAQCATITPDEARVKEFALKKVSCTRSAEEVSGTVKQAPAVLCFAPSS